jgi:hypothetical protein
MNLLSFLPWCKTALPRAARKPQAPDELPCGDDDGPRGCGWFDSSHDLQHGLQVREHLSAEALARELPLGFWLQLELLGCDAASAH